MTEQQIGDVIAFEAVRDRLVAVRGELALLDRDVASLYGVTTKEVNQAVRNNPDKFPMGYAFALGKDEIEILRSKIFTLESKCGKGHHSRHGYKVFTERGLYMLATILKSKKAVNATFAIIETFAKVRGLKRELLQLHGETNKKKQLKHTVRRVRKAE